MKGSSDKELSVETLPTGLKIQVKMKNAEDRDPKEKEIKQLPKKRHGSYNSHVKRQSERLKKLKTL